jgi:hypothetical protein
MIVGLHPQIRQSLDQVFVVRDTHLRCRDNFAPRWFLTRAGDALSRDRFHRSGLRTPRGHRVTIIGDSAGQRGDEGEFLVIGEVQAAAQPRYGYPAGEGHGEQLLPAAMTN